MITFCRYAKNKALSKAKHWYFPNGVISLILEKKGQDKKTPGKLPINTANAEKMLAIDVKMPKTRK
jgi:hypothetical protein